MRPSWILAVLGGFAAIAAVIFVWNARQPTEVPRNPFDEDDARHWLKS